MRSPTVCEHVGTFDRITFEPGRRVSAWCNECRRTVVLREGVHDPVHDSADMLKVGINRGVDSFGEARRTQAARAVHSRRLHAANGCTVRPRASTKNGADSWPTGGHDGA